MPTIEAEVSPRDLLRAVAQLKPVELEEFVSAVLTLKAERASPAVQVTEAELLQQVRYSLPEETRSRYRELTAKRRAASLTAEEHAELLRLTDAIENSDAARVRTLGQLAQLRNQSLEQLMADLGIQVPAYE